MRSIRAGRGARHRHRDAGVLVIRCLVAEADDRPARLCRRWHIDPTSTDGKDAKKTKQIELSGWPYQSTGGAHLWVGCAWRRCGHRRRSPLLVRLARLDGINRCRGQARLDRYIGYYKPYATSHDELDRDTDVQDEVRNVARAVAAAVRALRAGKLASRTRNSSRLVRNSCVIKRVVDGQFSDLPRGWRPAGHNQPSI